MRKEIDIMNTVRRLISVYSVPVSLYGIVLALVFGRALFPDKGFLLFGDDIHRSYYFFSQYLTGSLKQGFFPWWNPYLFSGTPFLANPITNAFYPVNWFFFLLPATIVYPLSIMLHVLIAMMGMYVLVRSTVNGKLQTANVFQFSVFSLPFSIGPWGAGLVFGLSSFFSARIYAGHIDVISAASWLPWVVYLFTKAFASRKPKDIVIAGAALGLQLLAGYQTMAVLTLIAVGIIALVQAISTKSIVPLRVLILGVLIAVGLASILLIPIQQFVGLSIRTFEKPYQWSSLGSLSPKELIQLISPFALGDQYTYQGSPPNYWEHAIFVGRVGLVLMGLLLVQALRSRTLRKKLIVFVLIAVFGLWVSFGNNAPVDLNYLLWRLNPLYHFLRIPARHLLLVVFGASVLVGCGLASLRNRWLKGIAVIILTIEMTLYARHFIVTKEIPETRHDKELISLMHDDKSLYRILPNFGVWVQPRDSLDFDSMMEYNLYSTTGYDSTLLRNYYEFIDAVNGATKPSILDHDVQVPYTNIYRSNWKILNVKYLLVPTYIDQLNGSSNDQFTLLREDLNRQYRLYENKHVIPRFFFVPRIQVVESREEAYTLIRNQTVDLTNVAIVERKNAPKRFVGLLPCSEPPRQNITITSYDPNRITLSVTTPCDTVLTSSEVKYPGWEARIDGKKAELFEANLAFRTLLIPQGKHNIELRYNPKIFIYGGMISILTFLACAVWWKKSEH